MPPSHLTLRVPEKLMLAIDAMAEDMGVNRSKMIKAILESAAQQHEGRATPKREQGTTLDGKIKIVPLRLPVSCIPLLEQRSANAMLSRNAWMSGLVQRELTHGENYFPADMQALEVARATLVDTSRELRDSAGSVSKKQSMLHELREAWGAYSQLLSEIISKARGR